MMPGRGVLSTIARRFVYSRPDGDGASQSVGVSRQSHRNPGSNLGSNPDQLPSTPSAILTVRRSLAARVPIVSGGGCDGRRLQKCVTCAGGKPNPSRSAANAQSQLRLC